MTPILSTSSLRQKAFGPFELNGPCLAIPLSCFLESSMTWYIRNAIFSVLYNSFSIIFPVLSRGSSVDAEQNISYQIQMLARHQFEIVEILIQYRTLHVWNCVPQPQVI